MPQEPNKSPETNGAAGSDLNVDQVMGLIRRAAAGKSSQDNEQELSIDGIMAAIKSQAAAKNHYRPSDLSPTMTGPPPTCREVNDQPFSANPEFAIKDRYTLEEFTLFHDRQFIDNAYQAILRRQPDPGGTAHFLAGLRKGIFSKIEVLGRLRYSPEGRKKRTVIKGLLLPFFLHSLFKTPLIGRPIRIVVGLINLPTILKNIQVIENTIFIERHESRQKLDHIGNMISGLREQLHSFQQETSQTLNDHAKKVELSALADKLEAIDLSAKNSIQRVHQEFAAQIKVITESLHPTHQAENDELLANFQEKFRGPQAEITKRLTVYLPLVRAAIKSTGGGKIIDLGCGRGEWLKLLKSQGIPAAGVDQNQKVIGQCLGEQLDVSKNGALDFLGSLEENSLIAVTGIHLVEHLSFNDIIDLFEQVRRVLRPAGIFILETPNPRNILVGGSEFYRDPTHNHPLFPESLLFIAIQKGLVNCHTFFLETSNDGPTLRDTETVEFNDLEDYVKVSRDFAFVGYKPCE